MVCFKKCLVKRYERKILKINKDVSIIDIKINKLGEKIDKKIKEKELYLKKIDNIINK
jgi:hypothetical protein